MAYTGMPQVTGYAYGRLIEVMGLIKMTQMTEAYSAPYMCLLQTTPAYKSMAHVSPFKIGGIK